MKKGKKCPMCGMSRMDQHDKMIGGDAGDDTQENDNLDTTGVHKKNKRVRDLMTAK